MEYSWDWDLWHELILLLFPQGVGTRTFWTIYTWSIVFREQKVRGTSPTSISGYCGRAQRNWPIRSFWTWKDLINRAKPTSSHIIAYPTRDNISSWHIDQNELYIWYRILYSSKLLVVLSLHRSGVGKFIYLQEEIKGPYSTLSHSALVCIMLLSRSPDSSSIFWNICAKTMYFWLLDHQHCPVFSYRKLVPILKKATEHKSSDEADREIVFLWSSIVTLYCSELANILYSYYIEWTDLSILAAIQNFQYGDYKYRRQCAYTTAVHIPHKSLLLYGTKVNPPQPAGREPRSWLDFSKWIMVTPFVQLWYRRGYLQQTLRSAREAKEELRQAIDKESDVAVPPLAEGLHNTTRGAGPVAAELELSLARRLWINNQVQCRESYKHRQGLDPDTLCERWQEWLIRDDWTISDVEAAMIRRGV